MVMGFDWMPSSFRIIGFYGINVGIAFYLFGGNL